MSTHLVTGGTASGKSAWAEGLLTGAGDVVYLATGDVPGPDDAEWAARVAAHAARRPPGWTTLETRDVVAVLGAPGPPVLWDSVGSWLTGVLDAAGAWEDAPGWREEVEAAMDDGVRAWARPARPVVAVTDEVGWGLVAPSAGGRLFTDLLGRLNQRLAATAGAVTLVVAGCPLHLRGGSPA